MEKIIKEEIVKFLEDNKKITRSQHGFRSKKSCLTNLLHFMERILEQVDENEPVDIFFFDLQKAFDKVPHKRLLYKLHEIGIQGKVKQWIEEWLKGRKQRVVLNACVSDWMVTSGVPQGSVLGPILFIIFINDMEEKVKSLFWKLADDSKMIGQVGSCADTSIVKTDLIQFGEWTKKWLMSRKVE